MALSFTLILLACLLVIGLPVALAMGVSGALGIWLIAGERTLLGILSTAPITTVSNYEIITIPMFILMAEFIILSGIAKDLFNSAAIWMGRVRGGLAMATALAGAGFAAISGSSTAAAATLSATSLPTMLEMGYDPKLAGGAVAISGTLAMLIPPSIALILYGIIADIPVGDLLIGGVIPGLIVTMAIIGTIALLVRLDPNAAPRATAYSLSDKIRSLKHVGPMLLLIFVVTGIIYLGVATPTEAAALGAFVAMLLAAKEKALTLNSLSVALKNTLQTTAMIFFIMLGAQVFGYFLTLSQITNEIVQIVVSLPVPELAIMAIILLGYVILGFFMDQVAILILTVPILLPVIKSMGFDPIWFGVIIIVTAEVGMVTPPMGMNVFVVARYAKRPLGELFAGAVPHVLAHLVVIGLLTIFPGLILWLPATMK